MRLKRAGHVWCVQCVVFIQLSIGIFSHADVVKLEARVYIHTVQVWLQGMQNSPSGVCANLSFPISSQKEQISDVMSIPYV